MPVILTYVKFSLEYTVICCIREHIIPNSNSLCRQWDIKCVGHFFLTVAVLFDIQKQRVACQTLVILQHLTGKCITNTRTNAQLHTKNECKEWPTEIRNILQNCKSPTMPCINVEIPSQCSPHSILRVLIRNSSINSSRNMIFSLHII